MKSEIQNLISVWERHNIKCLYCENKQEALDKLLEMIPKDASVGFSGSETLHEMNAIESLKKRGNTVFDPYLPDLSKEERLKLRKQASSADYYLASANGISQKSGELVFFSAYGNRTAGISFAKNVIIVCGINKLTPNLEAALKRSREFSTPLNCQRLNWKTPCREDGICKIELCLFPEYKRMCCQILIIEAEAIDDRLKVILVAEKLGF